MSRTAVRFHTFGDSPIVEEIEEPVTGPEDERVRVIRAAIAHIDVTVASGEFALRPDLPYVGGSEGLVELDGKRHLVRGGGVGLNRDGCWTTLAAVPRKALMEVPRELEPDTAVAFFGPASAAARAVDLGQVRQGQRVLVTGASGAVGSLVVQMCRSIGAHVTGVVSSATKAEYVRADDLVVGSGALAVEALSIKPEVLIDTVGGEDASGFIEAVQPSGVAVLLGYTAGTSLDLNLPSWLMSDVTLIPVNMVRAESWARQRFDALCEAFINGELEIRVERTQLQRVPAEIDRLRGGEVVGRVVVYT